jgi:hypothetical protein
MKYFILKITSVMFEEMIGMAVEIDHGETGLLEIDMIDILFYFYFI